MDVLDVLRVLRFDCGQTVPINTSNADVNEDGKADLSDALLMLRYCCGWSVLLR